MKKKTIIKFLIFLLFAGCDFTSGVHKDVLQAQDYLKSNKYEKAVDLYEKIITKKPSKQLELKIHFQLGELYTTYLNKFREALENYNQIINLTDDVVWQVKALESIADIYFDKTKNYEQANKTFKKLSQFRPKLNKHNYYLLKEAQSDFNLHHYDKANSLFEELIKTNDNGIDVISYYYLGYIAFLSQKWNLAIKYWFENLKRETNIQNKVKVKFLIGNAYESSERLKDAYNIYYSIIGQYPNHEIIKSRLDSLYKRRVAKRR